MSWSNLKKKLAYRKKQRERARLTRYIKNSQCPDCKTKNHIIEGSHGGLAINVMCEYCQSKFNVTPFGVDRI
jgi:hypothetical protein